MAFGAGAGISSILEKHYCGVLQVVWRVWPTPLPMAHSLVCHNVGRLPQPFDEFHKLLHPTAIDLEESCKSTIGEDEGVWSMGHDGYFVKWRLLPLLPRRLCLSVDWSAQDGAYSKQNNIRFLCESRQ